MYIAITRDIEVKVSVKFAKHLSEPLLPLFKFTYHITLFNYGKNPVKLMSRFWEITDALGHKTTVTGDGVVGLQPIISPNNAFDYESITMIKSEIGKMKGRYTMINQVSSEQFAVEIPEFELISPSILN